MTGDIPVQVWLIVLFAVMAIEPARYIWDHIAHSPSSRDITQPPEDLNWRTTDRLVRNLAVLFILLSASIFIFTSAAERFARSPEFILVMMSSIGVAALATLINGFRRAEVRPLIRGVSSTYDRRSQPKRYWFSMAWNAIFGAALLGFALPAYRDAGLNDLRTQCSDDDEVFSQAAVISACAELIASSEGDSDDLANAYLDRGIAYHRFKSHDEAISDYTRAMLLDPNDYFARYNRGLIYAYRGNYNDAINDFDAAIALKENEADAYLERGLLYLNNGEIDLAVKDFTSAHKYEPTGAWPLANRGIAYAWLGERIKAESDFFEVRKIDPENPVLLRGEALLRFNAGDYSGAIARFGQAIERDPDNAWAYSMRAEAYRKVGDLTKAYADYDAIDELQRKVSDERMAAEVGK